MTNQQASNVVAMLNAGYPNQALEEESIAVWIQEVALLKDPVVGIEAARQTIRNLDKFPSIKEYRSVYRSTAERAREEQQKALPEPAWSSMVPEWVQVWFWLRRVRKERRNVPNQIGYAVPDGPYQPEFMTEQEFAIYREEWVLAGSPAVPNAAMMAKAMSGMVG